MYNKNGHLEVKPDMMATADDTVPSSTQYTQIERGPSTVAYGTVVSLPVIVLTATVTQ